MTTATDDRSFAATFAPMALATVAILVGLWLPFIGLPMAMVSVVAVAVAEIQERRIRHLTVAVVVVSIVINLLLVLMALPAGRQLVDGSL